MKKYTRVIFVATVVLWTMVILNFCSCTSMTGPAKQQKITTSSRTQVTPQAPISVDQIDLNNDGKIDNSEYQALTEDRPGVLSTFLCIGGATILVCLGTAWLSRNVPPANKPEEIQVEQDQIIHEDFDGVQPKDGDWLDSGQDFDNGGKRR